MTTEQSLAEFQAILEKHRANEVAYKEKVKEINLTRGKISDQLEILQQTYDKKLKGLEQKLEILKTQNESLIRENVLYKSEIQTYQSRLLEKEKIIAVLLGQRKDLLPIGSSERSKSDKTDSLIANEESAKSFKKQGATFKQDYEHPPAQKLKEEPVAERQKQNTESIIVPVAPVPVAPKIDIQPQIKRPALPPKKKAPPVPPPQENKSIQPSPTNNGIEALKEVEESEPVHARTLPPPPPSHKGKARKSPPVFQVRKYESSEHEREEQHFQASDFFRDIGKSQEMVVQHKVEPHSQPQQLHQEHHDLLEEEVSLPQQNQEQITDEVEQIQEDPNDQVAVEEQLQQQITQPQQQEYNPYHQQEMQQEVQVPARRHEDIQEAEPEANPEPFENANNYYSQTNHGQNVAYAESLYEPYRQKAKKKANSNSNRNSNDNKGKKALNILEMEEEVSGTDFFSQLAKAEHEPHHLEIQQSSIDHIDRDNSLLSNEQPYFAEESIVTKPRPVKMPKKKGKRDQIKMIDPSCFE